MEEITIPHIEDKEEKGTILPKVSAVVCEGNDVDDMIDTLKRPQTEISEPPLERGDVTCEENGIAACHVTTAEENRDEGEGRESMREGEGEEEMPRVRAIVEEREGKSKDEEERRENEGDDGKEEAERERDEKQELRDRGLEESHDVNGSKLRGVTPHHRKISTADDADFLKTYHSRSRLHHLSEWKTTFRDELMKQIQFKLQEMDERGLPPFLSLSLSLYFCFLIYFVFFDCIDSM